MQLIATIMYKTDVVETILSHQLAGPAAFHRWAGQMMVKYRDILNSKPYEEGKYISLLINKNI